MYKGTKRTDGSPSTVFKAPASASGRQEPRHRNNDGRETLIGRVDVAPSPHKPVILLYKTVRCNIRLCRNCMMKTVPKHLNIQRIRSEEVAQDEVEVRVAPGLLLLR